MPFAGRRGSWPLVNFVSTSHRALSIRVDACGSCHFRRRMGMIQTMCVLDPGRSILATDPSPGLLTLSFSVELTQLAATATFSRQRDGGIASPLISSSQVHPQSFHLDIPLVLTSGPEFKRGTADSMHRCGSTFKCLKPSSSFQSQCSPQHHRPKSSNYYRWLHSLNTLVGGEPH
jgi:hypothetical protein